MGSNKNLLTFKPDGKMGIGTDAPAAPLDVEGNIVAGQVVGTFLNWTPDHSDASLKRLLTARNPYAGFGVTEAPDHVSPSSGCILSPETTLT